MNDIDWGSEAKAVPKAKARFPKWLWFCGGGCLLAVIASVVLVVVIGKIAKEKLDPEKQWTKLEKILPHEERPTGFELIPTGAFGAMAPGVEDAWQFLNSNGTQVQIQHHVGASADSTREQIESGALTSAKQSLGPIGVFEATAGEFEASGKTVHFVRFQTFEAEAETPETEAKDPNVEEDQSPSARDVWDMATKMRLVMADITPEGVDGTVVLIFSKPRKLGPLEQSEVIDFLSTFQLGAKK